MENDDGIRSAHRGQQWRERKAFGADLAGGARAREIRLVTQMRITVRERADLR